MAIPPVTPLPTPPSRSRPDDFATEADAFLGALDTFGTELDALGDAVELAETATATSETNAAASAAAAATSETNAATSETNAAASETNAASSAAAAAASFDSFDDRYLGPKSSDPTTDNDGDALSGGMIYYNTGSGTLKLYNGTAWTAAVLDANGALLAVNNLSDVADAATARANLGITGDLGTLTKSFAADETETITLNSSISPTPVVGVTKEIGQTGASSKGAWDVNATGSNYELYDQAPATSLSLSSTSADGTATLGTGSFSSSDVGKRIFVDDGGEAILTATDGSYSLVTSFGASSYTSGNWSLTGLDVDATNGITLSGVDDSYNLTDASYDNVSFSVALQETSPYGLSFKSDGTRMYVMGSAGDDINEYTLSTAWDISTASYTTVHSLSTKSNPSFLTFKPDGTKFYIVNIGNDFVYQYDLTTAWNLSTASYASKSYDVNPDDIAPRGIFFKTDGTKMYIVGAVGQAVLEYNLSTAWDLSTTSYSQSFNFGFSGNGLFFKSDGYTMYISNDTADTVQSYILSTAWDVSTASSSTSFSVSEASSPNGIYFGLSGTKLYVLDLTADTVYQYSTGEISQPTAQYLPALTSAGGQIDSTYWTDINSMTADDTDNDGQVYYAVSTDDRTTWSVAKASDGERDIVRNNGGTWEYNSNATYASTTWTSATTNDEFAAIAQAMTVAANQMDKAQLDAVADGSHFTLGNTLDLAIIPYLASTGTVPTSDGVSINYDAAALNKGAVLGTDYDYDFPAGDKVRITSLAAQNLKVRVV